MKKSTRYLAAYMEFTAKGFLQSKNHFLDVFSLHYVPHRARAERSLGICTLVVHGEDHRHNVRELRFEILKKFDAIHSGERNVRQYAIRPQFRNSRNRIYCVVRFTANYHSGFLGQVESQRLADNSVVFDDEYFFPV